EGGEGDGRGGDEAGLAGKGSGKLGGVARITPGDRGRHADVPFRGANDRNRVRQRVAFVQIETDGDGRKLLLVRDGERRRGRYKTGKGGQGHLIAARHRIGRRSG